MSSVKKFARAGASDEETDLAKSHYLLEPAFQLTVADSVVWYEQLQDLFEEGQGAADVDAARRARLTADYMKQGGGGEGCRGLPLLPTGRAASPATA